MAQAAKEGEGGAAATEGEGGAAATDSLTTRLLTPGDWPAIESLFGANGACGGCWCMWWRVDRGGKTWTRAKGDPNRQAFRTLVEAGAVKGTIAWRGGTPVGWCNFGPRPDFPRLDRSRVLQRAPDPAMPRTPWSIACFYVKAAARGQGVAQALLAHATAECFARGAAEVEGYPKTVKTASGRAPGAFVFTGVPALFAKAGFTRLARPPGQRPIWVKRAPGAVRG
jgi:GNAT superfamily N-acetyltransferase